MTIGIVGIFGLVSNGYLKLLRRQHINCARFDTSLFSGLWICHLEFSEHIQNELGDDEAYIFLVIFRNNIPGEFQAELVSRVHRRPKLLKKSMVSRSSER